MYHFAYTEQTAPLRHWLSQFTPELGVLGLALLKAAPRFNCRNYAAMCVCVCVCVCVRVRAYGRARSQAHKFLVLRFSRSVTWAVLFSHSKLSTYAVVTFFRPNIRRYQMQCMQKRLSRLDTRACVNLLATIFSPAIFLFAQARLKTVFLLCQSTKPWICIGSWR